MSCTSFPVIIDNPSSHEINLEYRLKESREEHLEYWKKKPIRITLLPQDLINECRVRFKYPEISIVNHNFQTNLPPYNRICISINGSPEEVFESLIIISRKGTKEIKSEFRYFRTSVDTVGYVYRISDEK